jgi:hypothetical protein
MATEVPRPGQPVPSAPVQSRAQRRHHHQLLCRPTVEDPGGTKNVPVRIRGSEAQVAFHHASQSRRSLSFTERQITPSRGSGALITSGRCRRRPVPCGCFRPGPETRGGTQAGAWGLAGSGWITGSISCQGRGLENR